MKLHEAFATPIELKFADGKTLKLSRVSMRQWAAWTAKLVESRLEIVTNILKNDANVPPPARVKLRMEEAAKPAPSLPEVVGIVTRSAEHIRTLLVEQAMESGHAEADAELMVDAIAPPDQYAIAALLIDAPPEGKVHPLLVPLIRNNSQTTQGTAGDSESADSKDSSSDSTPGISPTANSSTANAA